MDTGTQGMAASAAGAARAPADGRCALVLGASGGIGGAVARALRDAGWRPSPSTATACTGCVATRWIATTCAAPRKGAP